MTTQLQTLADTINNELQTDQDLGTYAIKARVYQNGFVQLQGIVDVLEEKKHAEELVWRIPGVKRIENDITVCTDGEIDDHDVAFEVSEELRANVDVPDSVGFRVQGGEVELIGSIQSQSEAAEAVETASKARGVREVHDRLKVVEVEDDATITNNIQVALLEDPDLTTGLIKVQTESGVVSLWGDVPEREAVVAMEIASHIAGVKEVVNHLNMKEASAKIFE